MDENYPWVEEFRPQKIEDVIGAEKNISKFNAFIDNKSFPSLLLVGAPGTGKTTTAKILAKAISGEDGYLYINASDERGMDTIRNKVQDFCGVAGFTELKTIILDESDGMTVDAQKILRAVTEQYHKSCRFILTANYENKIIEPVRSRFQTFYFESADMNQIAKRCLDILVKKKIIRSREDAEAAKSDVTTLVKRFYPDIRSIINNLQRFSNGGVFKLADDGVTKEATEKFLELIKTKKIKEIRKDILLMSADYDSLFDAIYKNIDKLTQEKTKICDIIILLANYQYQNSTHANKELNFVACLLEIMRII